MVGVFMFLFYVFNRPPMLFNSEYTQKVEESARAADYHSLEGEFSRAYEKRREAATALAATQGPERPLMREQFREATAEMQEVRSRAANLVKNVTGVASYGEKTGDTPKPDVNYVFPTFVTTSLPQGLVGLIIAAIFAAAMSATAGELSATATTTVMDIYRRLVRTDQTDKHYLMVSRLAVAFWGLVACVVAHVAVQLGSLIEVVNRIGSIFYGSLLGVFVLALAVPRANGHGAFIGLLSGILFVIGFAWYPATRNVSYLWHNPIGVAVVLIVGVTVSLLTRPQAAK
jgi:Na+(H+)/acetate symporter ActP